ncbi:MAG TPA: carboxypeptidase regulatory-like domain-containing protein [Gemmatimonadales bacterium]
MVGLLVVFALQTATPDTLPPSGVIAGVVTDVSHRPIQRAIVTILPGGREVFTDAKGSFEFRSRAPGLHILAVRALGYRQRLVQVSLGAGEGWRRGVDLALAVHELPEIEARVNAWKPAEYAGTSRYDGFFQRKRLGMGTHLSRDQIDRLGALHFTQILQRVPGFRVAWNPPGSQQPTTVKITRCAEANPPKVALYVDGIRRRSSSSELSQGYGLVITGGRGRRQSGGEYAVEQFAELLDSVNPRDIEMVEVYRGVAQIPADFDRDVCAVIAIWTRWNQG